MPKRDQPPYVSLADLRARAEAAILRTHGTIATRLEQDVAKLLRELDVHRMELELQNEELIAARTELEENRLRYYRLYESAPVGYLSLDRGGRIRELNRRARELLGIDTRLEGRPLITLVRPSEADTLRFHLERVFATGERRACEVALHRHGRCIPVRIDSVAVDEGQACFSVLIDLSEPCDRPRH